MWGVENEREHRRDTDGRKNDGAKLSAMLSCSVRQQNVRALLRQALSLPAQFSCSGNGMQVLMNLFGRCYY